jgi:anti-sigma-K factor RskA
MNMVELQKKLTAASRAQAPDERVPYAFEKRVVALIQARAGVDRWAFWAQGLWRAAVMCVAVAIVAGAMLYFMDSSTPGKGGDLSQEFVNTLLATADQPDFSQMP